MGFNVSAGQILYLDEIMRFNSNTTQAYLDFKAAYDLVDRRLLWAKLKNEFDFPDALVSRLRMLFESNESVLRIQGSVSTPMPNLRGLLQGSSLSPILFNFFVDSLLKRFNAAEMPKISHLGLRTNSLALADDVNLHTTSVAGMRTLLTVAENWSVEQAMHFTPTKYIVIGNTDVANPLTIYGEPLTVQSEAVYLGMWYNLTGVNWPKNVAKRVAKAREAAQGMIRFGMNGTVSHPALVLHCIKHTCDR